MTQRALGSRASESESMGAQEDNGLTLEGLAQKLETQAQRLETLERENERMRSENAELRQEVSAQRGAGTRRGEVAEARSSGRRRDGEAVSQFEGRVSRRSLLSKAGAAAVAAVAAGTLMNAREAKAGVSDFDIILAESVWCGDLGADTKGVAGTHTGAGGTGVTGRGDIGVKGESSRTGYSAVHGYHNGFGSGVVGDGWGTSYAGVLGRNGNGTGVRGETSKVGHAAVVGKHSNAGFDAIGVLGTTNDGVGVKGLGKIGVIGESSKLGHAAVYGEHTGLDGPGVVGDGNGQNSAGVLGRNPIGFGVWGEGTLSGVWGEGDGTGVTGTASLGNGFGVEGRSPNGYGGAFSGGRGNLLLYVHPNIGPPTSNVTHSKGALYMDANANLFVCTQTGSPGTWRRFTTVAT